MPAHPAVAWAAALPLSLDVETAHQAWSATSRLAPDFRLTIHDASHLEPAQRLNLPLGTADMELCSAADALAIELPGHWRLLDEARSTPADAGYTSTQPTPAASAAARSASSFVASGNWRRRASSRQAAS